MYNSLSALCSNIGKPWLLLGDYNEILYPNERIGVYRFDASMKEFQNWVNDMCFIDVPLHGIKFTWSRNNSQSKLDWCFCNDEWLVEFPQIRLEGLPKASSDHNPILLSLENDMNWGPKPFRSYDCWFLHPNFKEFVRNEWKELPNLCLFNKFKALKDPIKRWSKEKFGAMERTISNLENEIHKLQKMGENRNLSQEECSRWRACQNHLHAWLIRRERLWRQKARAYGFSLKDQNTKFFHATTLMKRKRNEIVQLEFDGNMVKGVEEVKHELYKHFASRFSQSTTT